MSQKKKNTTYLLTKASQYVPVNPLNLNLLLWPIYLTSCHSKISVWLQFCWVS